MRCFPKMRFKGLAPSWPARNDTLEPRFLVDLIGGAISAQGFGIPEALWRRTPGKALPVPVAKAPAPWAYRSGSIGVVLSPPSRGSRCRGSAAQRERAVVTCSACWITTRSWPCATPSPTAWCSLKTAKVRLAPRPRGRSPSPGLPGPPAAAAWERRGCRASPQRALTARGRSPRESGPPPPLSGLGPTTHLGRPRCAVPPGAVVAPKTRGII